MVGVRRVHRPGPANDAVSCCGVRRSASTDNDWAYINYTQVPLTGPGDYLGAGHWSDPEESMIDWDALRFFLRRCGVCLLCAVVVAAVTWPFVSRRFEKTEDETRRTSVAQGLEAQEPAPLPSSTEPGPATTEKAIITGVPTSSESPPRSAASTTTVTSTSSSTTTTTPQPRPLLPDAPAAEAAGGGPPPVAPSAGPPAVAAAAPVPGAPVAPAAPATPAAPGSLQGCAAECTLGNWAPEGTGWDSAPSS